MFENQLSADVEAYLKTDAEFRRLYQQHQQLDRKVHDADLGVLAIDDLSLQGMKREKLRVKKRLERMWAARPRPAH